jgi:hypothetical protein
MNVLFLVCVVRGSLQLHRPCQGPRGQGPAGGPTRRYRCDRRSIRQCGCSSGSGRHGSGDGHRWGVVSTLQVCVRRQQATNPRRASSPPPLVTSPLQQRSRAPTLLPYHEPTHPRPPLPLPARLCCPCSGRRWTSGCFATGPQSYPPSSKALAGPLPRLSWEWT